jgi:hypothetical protein
MMSIYEDIKTAAGAAPAYPHKNEFTSVFGYAYGQSIGSFPNKAAAEKAGAKTTEAAFDAPAFDAAKALYDAHYSAILTEWKARVRAEYPEINDKVFALIDGLAYEDGHSAGYHEVELYIDKYAEFAKAVIAAA